MTTTQVTNRLKPGSTNTVLVQNVYDTINAIYANVTTAAASSAANACALLTADKVTNVANIPVTFVPGTLGDWRGIVADTVALTDNTAYYARITIIFNNGTVRRFDIPCVTSADD